MSSQNFTPGHWRVVVRTTNGVQGYEICWSDDGECITDHVYKEADAYLIAAAKELYGALRKEAVDAEQCRFEDWLASECPSGDSESVHSKWRLSDSYAEFLDEWAGALSALAKARGES